MNTINNNSEFDFDAWASLAKEDPEAFENKRKQMLQDVIDNAEPEIKRRMQGLQWQVDQIRSTSANPMASCLKISQMMWDKTIGEGGLVEHMEQLSDPMHNQNKLRPPKESAIIMDLKDRLNKEKD